MRDDSLVTRLKYIEKIKFQEELEFEQLFREFISSRRWQFAKTYASFCPHEYIMRQWLSEKESKLFTAIGQGIVKFGWSAIYGSSGDQRFYYPIDGLYYWNMDKPELTNVLNRAKFDDFIFEENLFGDIHIKSRWRGGKKVL